MSFADGALVAVMGYVRVTETAHARVLVHLVGLLEFEVQDLVCCQGAVELLGFELSQVP